jgi:hypothetical protein
MPKGQEAGFGAHEVIETLRLPEAPAATEPPVECGSRKPFPARTPREQRFETGERRQQVNVVRHHNEIEYRVVRAAVVQTGGNNGTQFRCAKRARPGTVVQPVFQSSRKGAPKLGSIRLWQSFQRFVPRRVWLDAVSPKPPGAIGEPFRGPTLWERVPRSPCDEAHNAGLHPMWKGGGVRFGFCAGVEETEFGEHRGFLGGLVFTGGRLSPKVGALSAKALRPVAERVSTV